MYFVTQTRCVKFDILGSYACSAGFVKEVGVDESWTDPQNKSTRDSITIQSCGSYELPADIP